MEKIISQGFVVQQFEFSTRASFGLIWNLVEFAFDFS
jgi:hypothetical protein